MSITHTGGCLCGGVRYAITGDLPPIQICHCGQCRKAQGGAFAANIPVDAAAFSLVRGAELLGDFESSPGKQRAFCRRCGSPIHSRRIDLPGVLRVRAGGLDGEVASKPDAHAFTGSKANWWAINDDLPQYSGTRPADAVVRADAAALPLVNGIDHIYVAVSDMAVSQAFYDRVFVAALGFRKNSFALNADVGGGEPHVQYYGRHFGYVIRPARTPLPHDPYAPGLHHFCLRVDGEAQVRAAYEALREAGVAVSEPARFAQYAPDYVAIFFADPDGVRLEIANHRAERRQRHDRWSELKA